MIDISKIDYSVLDREDVLTCLFHPRPEWEGLHTIPPERQVMIPVEDRVAVAGCFHTVSPSAPTILFFHGNGEIVADYHDMALEYTRRGINFFPVDYRGYGRSSGRPTVTAMMRDCHRIFDFTKRWLREKAFTGPLMVMGRSLGSASALELACHYPEATDGLIIESGFAYAAPLLQLLGVSLSAIGFEEKDGFRNVDKIWDFDRPLLVIHAEQDHIIPFSDGQALYDACNSPDKTLLKIPGANHNDLMHVGFSDYMKAIQELSEKLIQKEREK